ncbi:MAG: hypothetical protein ACRDMV_06630 [Streptosporangiales bacterium]
MTTDTDVRVDAGQTSFRTTVGLRLLGEYQDSGFAQPRFLAQRADGQVLQLTRLLYVVLAAVDDCADYEQLAARVGAEYGRALTAEQVGYLLSDKLAPLGLVSNTTAQSSADAPRSELLLGLKANRVLIPAGAVGRIAATLSWLHRPAVVIAVLAAFVAFDTWLFGIHGAVEALLGVLQEPAWILAALGLSLVAMVFHEFGHASACRYSGARPGHIGYGIYIVWPAMYTDVTDVYRIRRSGRLRTDLGGVYFNLIYLLAMAGCYWLTGQPIFLAVAFLSHLEILQQLVPIVRMDGYFILGDLAGIPDLFGKVKPILLSMRPGHPPDPRVAGLRRGARVAVTVWVLVVIPLLAANLAYLLWNLPRIVGVGAHSFVGHLDAATRAFPALDVLAGLANIVNMILLVVPLVGVVYLVARPMLKLARFATFRLVRARGRHAVG